MNVITNITTCLCLNVHCWLKPPSVIQMHYDHRSLLLKGQDVHEWLCFCKARKQARMQARKQDRMQARKQDRKTSFKLDSKLKSKLLHVCSHGHCAEH